MNRLHTFPLEIRNRRRSLAPTATPGPVVKYEIAGTPPESTSSASEKRFLRKHTSSRINSESVSGDAEEVDEVKPSIDRRKRQQQQEGGEEEARKKAKKEDEDVKPIIVKEEEGSTLGRRRSSRSRPQDAVPSLYLDGTDDEEDIDVKPRRYSRSRAPSALSPAENEEKAKIKVENKKIREDNKYEEALRNHENFVAWPPLQGVDPKTFSILDPDTWQGALRVTSPEVDALRKLSPFHYDVLKLGSGGCFMSRKSDSRVKAGYTHDIHGLRQELNLDMTAAGQAFAQTGAAKPFDPAVSLRPEEDSAIFCRLPNKSNERYQPFGMYRKVWQAQAKDGEYAKLSPKKKEEIFKIFLKYLSLKNWFTRLVFKDCHLETPEGKLHIRNKSLTRKQRHALIRSCLEKNRGLTVYWAMWVYVGNNAQEVADCHGRRSFRYPQQS